VAAQVVQGPSKNAVRRAVSPVHRLLPLLLLGLGCSKLFAKDAPPADDSKAEAEEHAPASGEAEAPEHATAGAGRYGIPFTYERSPEEPLAKARQFMADVLKDNGTFSGPSRERAAALADSESPRATVLTCSDSRVQPSVWDATPENDSYTVRVLGNQLAGALPSVQYGVDVLHTPVLLIIGHTGCDAASHAADSAKHKAADEHGKATRPGKARGSKDERARSEVVLDNVNAQVKEAVGHFAARVQSGDLTVIGAVYDVTNELGKGAGRLHLVNINGNVEAVRVKAFEDAVNEQNRKAAATTASKRSSPNDRARAFLDGSARLPPGARATVNAVSVVGNGGFDSVGEGNVREPLLGTPHDVKPVFSRRPTSTLSFANRGLGQPGVKHGDEQGGADAHGSADTHGKPDVHAQADQHKADPHATDAHATPSSHAAPEPHASPEKPVAEAHGDEPAKPAKPAKPARPKASTGTRKKASNAAEHGASDGTGAEPGEPPPLPWK
jgi:carbonic anhydrase